MSLSSAKDLIFSKAFDGLKTIKRLPFLPSLFLFFFNNFGSCSSELGSFIRLLDAECPSNNLQRMLPLCRPSRESLLCTLLSSGEAGPRIYLV